MPVLAGGYADIRPIHLLLNKVYMNATRFDLIDEVPFLLPASTELDKEYIAFLQLSVESGGLFTSTMEGSMIERDSDDWAAALEAIRKAVEYRPDAPS